MTAAVLYIGNFVSVGSSSGINDSAAGAAHQAFLTDCLGAGGTVQAVRTEAGMDRLGKARQVGLHRRVQGNAQKTAADHVDMAAAELMRLIVVSGMGWLLAGIIL